MSLYARPVAGVWYEASSVDMIIPRHGFVTFLGLECRKGRELGAVGTKNASLTGVVSLVWTCIIQVLLPKLAVLFDFPRRFLTRRGIGVWNFTTSTVETSGGTTSVRVQSHRA